MRLNSVKQQLTATYLQVPRSANLKEAAPKNSKRRHSHNLRESRGATVAFKGQTESSVHKYIISIVLISFLWRNTRPFLHNNDSGATPSYFSQTPPKFSRSFFVKYLDIRDKT